MSAKSKNEYILDENGEKVKLKNGNYKTRKIDTVDWNEQEKAEQCRKAWADITNKYLEENSIQLTQVKKQELNLYSWAKL